MSGDPDQTLMPTVLHFKENQFVCQKTFDCFHHNDQPIAHFHNQPPHLYNKMLEPVTAMFFFRKHSSSHTEPDIKY